LEEETIGQQTIKLNSGATILARAKPTLPTYASPDATLSNDSKRKLRVI